ncbi:large polymerase protein [Paraavulavirus neophemae]|uniref:RNA-directed RNA polymerase L n=1 Tax=Paraavulavirus wisconsinense TaxID=3052594 RepID=B5L5U0_9MONO|nr:large polymerase protein [Paraavulavirus wisconsinense]
MSSHNIILPDHHLNSPIVLNKLMYYCKLLNILPDPKSPWYEKIKSWTNCCIRVSDSNRMTLSRASKLRELLATYGVYSKNHQQCYTTIIHPQSLSPIMQTVSQLGRSIPTWARIRKEITHSIIAQTNKFESLFHNISKDLTGKTNLFGGFCDLHGSISTAAKRLMNQPGLYLDSPDAHACQFLFQLKTCQRELILLMRQNATTELIRVFDYPELRVLVTPEYSVWVFTRTKQVTLLTFDCLLMYCDLSDGRHNILFTCKLLSHLNHLGCRIRDLLVLIDSLAEKHPLIVYDVVASLESLSYGAIQLHDKVAGYAGTFFSFILAEIQDSLETVLDQGNSESIISQIRNIYSGLTVNEAAELLCVMRLWGHPALNSVDAASKVRQSMCAGKLLKFDTIQLVLAFFNTLIINGYRRKHHGRWPNVCSDSIIGNELKRMYFDQCEIPHDFTLKNYRELSLLEFECTFPIELSDKLNIFLKDKAIAFPKSRWTSPFKADITPRHLLQAPEFKTRANRLLLSFLQLEEFSIESELEYVTTLAYLDDDEFNVSYSLKEKEVKTDGRIFAKLTRKMRSCQVIFEELLAEHVSPLFKDNGVTMAELSLTKSLLAISNLSSTLFETQTRQGDRNARFTHAHFITTDLQKYCLNWRYQSVKLFARQLNRLFGLQHGFEWIHCILMKSTMYVADPFNPPHSNAREALDDNLNSDIFIVSPRGAIEGLCQKMWTIISISAIHASAAVAGLRVASMVQGDNQVIGVTREFLAGHDQTFVDDQLTVSLENFTQIFKEVNYGLGHNLKLRETIKSSHMFIYSKRIFYDGRVLPQLLKNIRKLTLSATTTGENCLTSCGDLSSCITRCIENGFPKDAAFVLNQLVIRIQILADHFYSILGGCFSGLNQADIRLLLYEGAILPAQLGGFNNLNMSRLFCRNIGDPLVASIADTKRFVKCQLLVPHILDSVVAITDRKGSFTTLMMDPYSINLDYIQQPETRLKRHVQKVLLQESVNPLLQGVFLESQQEEEEQLAAFLLDREVVMPRVAHAIFECTSLGRRRHIQGLIDTTKTIIALALDTQQLSYTKREQIVTYNATYMRSLASMLSSSHNQTRRSVIGHASFNITDCSVILAQQVRRASWAPLLNWRSLEGLEVPDPIESVAGYLGLDSNNCFLCCHEQNSYSWFFLPRMCHFDDSRQSNSIQRVPYIGSKTDERQMSTINLLEKTTCHARAATRLASLYIWAFGDSDDSWDAVETLSNSRCQITREHLQALCPMPSSVNLHHRLNDGITQVKFMPSTNSRVSRFVHISNDRQNYVLDDSVTDSNLIYQQVMLLGLSILETYFREPTATNLSSLVLHLHTDVSCCLRECPMTQYAPPLRDIPELTITASNPFLFDQEPISEADLCRLSKIAFRRAGDNYDAYDQFQLRATLAATTGKDVAATIFGPLAAVSAKNDAIVTNDYSGNWISEFRYSDLYLLSVSLGYEILLIFAYQLYYLRIRYRQNIVCYMESVFRRCHSLCLGDLIQTISHSEILVGLNAAGFNLTLDRSDLKENQLSRLAVKYLTLCVQTAISNLEVGSEPLCIIGGQLDDDISFQVAHFLCRRLCIISLVHSNVQNLPPIRDNEVDVKSKLIYDHLKLVATTLNNRDQSYLLTLLNKPNIELHTPQVYFIMRKCLGLLKVYGPVPQKQPLPTSPVVSLPNKCKSKWKLEEVIDSIESPKSFNWVPDTTIPLDAEQNPPNPNRVIDKINILRSLSPRHSVWYRNRQYRYVLSQLGHDQLGGATLYLGEGSGSTILNIEPKVRSDKIYYHTYFSADKSPAQRNFIPQPTTFLRSNFYHYELEPSGCEFINCWSEDVNATNLTELRCINHILTVIPVGSLTRIICDVELANDTSIQSVATAYMNLSILAHALLNQGGVCICRCHLLDTSHLAIVSFVLKTLSSQLAISFSGYCGTNDPSCVIGVTKECSISLDVLSSIAAAFINELPSNELPVPQSLLTLLGCYQDQLESLSALIEKTWIQEIREASFNACEMEWIGLLGTDALGDVDTFISYRNDSCNSIPDLLTPAVSALLFELISLTPELPGTEDQPSRRVISIGQAFNLTISGKVNTMIRSCCEQCIKLLAANVSILSDVDLSYFVRGIRDGSFALGLLITQRQILKASRAPKYLKTHQVQNWIALLLEVKLEEIFSRHYRKVLLRTLRLLSLYGLLQQKES